MNSSFKIVSFYSERFCFPPNWVIPVGKYFFRGRNMGIRPTHISSGLVALFFNLNRFSLTGRFWKVNHSQQQGLGGGVLKNGLLLEEEAKLLCLNVNFFVLVFGPWQSTDIKTIYKVDMLAPSAKLNHVKVWWKCCGKKKNMFTFRYSSRITWCKRSVGTCNRFWNW